MGKHILYILFVALGMAQISHAQQVITAPRLECVTKIVTNGNIILSWGNSVNNCGGAFEHYTIYGSTSPNGPFDSLIAITSATATVDTILNLTGTWYFYMTASYNCPGYTSLSSDTISTNPPAIPQFNYVSVLPNGNVFIDWLPDPSPQTAFYILYYYLPNGNATPFDTIYGRLSATAIDSAVNADNRSYVYSIAASDSCGNISSYTNLWDNTILATAAITECEKQLTISWNKFYHFPAGVLQYEIWVSTNGSPPIEAATVDSATASTYYTNFNNGDSLDIVVRAISAADTNIVSNSNVIAMRAFIDQPPGYQYITNITVDPSNHIDITWTIDTTAELLFYEITRSVDTTNPYILPEFSTPEPLQLFETYIDSNNISPQNNPYFYSVVAFDSCQNEFPSPYGESISLQGTLYEYYVAQLQWNSFYLPYATVLYYNLYRDIGNGNGYQLIKTFQPGVNIYYDSLQNFLNAEGTFCYKIEAVYYLSLPAPSNYQDTLISYSNVSCVVSQPIIYIPNAFSPGSNVDVNQVFKPTIIYGDPQDYSMIIFNRWGGKIFESSNPSLGWDGTDHGKEATMGGYGYFIQFTADGGVVVQETGIVMLVR